MGDLKSKKLICLKGFLFLFIMIMSSVLLIFEHPNFKVVMLLLLAMWGATRFYYFMFYVIENYVDENYKFSGIMSFVKYWLYKKKQS